MNLITKTLELDVNSVVFAVFTWHPSLVAEFAHEDELLEQAEIGVPTAAARACIVHQVSEQVVVIELFNFLEDAECVFGEPEGLIEKSALGSGGLLLWKLFEHVDGDFVQIEILLVFLVQWPPLWVVLLDPALHFVLASGNHFEQSLVPLRCWHLFKQAVMDATQDELLAALADLLSVHVLLQELIIVSHSIDVLTEVAQEIV